MSLDVKLTTKEMHKVKPGSGIFIRENGQTREITTDEWNRLHPDEQVHDRYYAINNGKELTIDEVEGETNEVFSANITHNLNTMAREAGIYNHLWRPDEIEITNAWQLITPLRRGLGLLKEDSQRFRRFNPENGWGDYEGLVRFVESYLSACEQYPYAEVTVSR